MILAPPKPHKAGLLPLFVLRKLSQEGRGGERWAEKRGLDSGEEGEDRELDCPSSNPSSATHQLCALCKSLIPSAPQFPNLQIGSSKYLLHRVVVKIKKVHVYEAFRTVLRTLAICYCCMIVIILL